MDELFWLRQVARLTAVASGIVIYLGYCLYAYAVGARSSGSRVAYSSRLMKLAASGTGPGLLCMVFGCAILVCSLVFGRVASTLSPGETVMLDVQSATNGEPRGAPAYAHDRSVATPSAAMPIPNAEDLAPEAATARTPSPPAASPAVREERRPRWEASPARRAARDLSATTGSIDERNLISIPPGSR